MPSVLFCALGMWKGLLDYLIAKRAKAYLGWSQSLGEQVEPAADSSPVSVVAA